MSTFPAYIQSLLWDVNIATINLDTHKHYIIERVLEYGGFDALHWIEQSFKKDDIIQTLKTSKRLSAKTGNFFAHYYNLDRNSLVCIQKPFTQKQHRFSH